MLGFPATVNERAARIVAGAVAAVGAAVLATGWWWLLVPVALGFTARVAAGPRLSPLARAAVALAPRLGPAKEVPGPPKRFAQAIGAAFSTTAAVAVLAFGATGIATGVLAVLVAFATLEAAFAFCAGCMAFGWLMRLGVVPQHVCEACADLRVRTAR